MRIHRDAYTAAVAMLVLAGLIALLLAIVNPIH